ncbi:MAG: FecCD family ABC transporter permease [Trueperaceae bacterium]
MQRTLLRATRALVWTPLFIASVLLVAVMVVAVGIGSEYIAPTEVLQAMFHGITGNLMTAEDTIIWQMRLPRVLLAALVGAALGVSGVTFQGLFRNPLADPYLLGVASGAGFGATLVMVFAASVPFFVSVGVPFAAFIGGLLSVALVFLLARQGRTVPFITLVLAGVVVGSVLTAATSFLMLYSREQGLSILAWLLGSFTFASWSKVFVMLPTLFVVTLVVVGSSRALNVLQLGEEQAMQLGLSVEKFKLLLIIVATLATSIAVSVSGIIGFVGLIIPHAVRLGVGADYRRITPLVAVVGALFLVLADLLARTLIAPSQLPIGIITSLVGGPFFLYLLRKRQSEIR